MSGEASLWVRLREAVKGKGHFCRLEYNPTVGIPDVDYCVFGVEGKIELKDRPKAPARATTAAFGDKGLRDEQVGWILTRIRHGGLVWVMAEVGPAIYLIHGSWAEAFNEMTVAELERASTWRLPVGPLKNPGAVSGLLGALMTRDPGNLRLFPRGGAKAKRGI